MDDNNRRYHTIDHLRATMISIVMFGHALLPYTTIPRSFKDPQTHIGFDVVTIFLYNFAMPAFFVTAGFSTALIYRRKGPRGLAHNRLMRIFVPLLVAYIVLSPLTAAAYKFAKQAALTGSLQVGLDEVLLGEWIRWGNTYHLWFLVALLLYTAMALGIRWGIVHFPGDAAGRIRSASRSFLISRWRSTLLTLVISSMMIPAYVIYGADAGTLPGQFALFTFFLFGWSLYLHRDLLPTLQDRPWRPIIVALVVTPLAVWSARTRLMSPDEPQLLVGIVAGLSHSVIAAFMSFGLLGVYQAHLNRESEIGRYVSNASYWIYLVHFPLIIAIAGVFTVTPLPAITKYLLTLAIAVPIVWSTYHFGVRLTPFGGAPSAGKPLAAERQRSV